MEGPRISFKKKGYTVQRKDTMGGENDEGPQAFGPIVSLKE